MSFEIVNATLNNNYVTGTVNCYKLCGKFSMFAIITVKSDVTKWVHLIRGIPSVKSDFFIKDINGAVTVQYHSDGLIQTCSDGLKKGEYIFVTQTSHT